MSQINVDKVVDTSGGVLAPISSVFRNRIINGAMVIDQRNAGASVTPANGDYALDRFQTILSASSKYSVQQNAGSVTPPVGFTNYLGVTSLSAYTVGASERFQIRQYVEGFNTADLGWGTANAQTITLSFWVRSSLTGTFGGVVANSAQNRSYPFTYTINSANTWEYETITIAGDTSGTWIGATNGIGLQLAFSLGAGSSVSGTAGAWAGSGLSSATGATSVVGTNGATFYITGVQLEKGSTATSFDYRPYGTEFFLCQRYYQRNLAGVGGAGSSTQCAVTFPLVPPMRVQPTTTLLNGTTAIDELYTANRTVTNIDSAFGSNDGTTSFGVTLATNGLTTQRMTTLFSGRIGLNAEL